MAISKDKILEIVKDRERVVFSEQIKDIFLSDKLGRIKGKADALVFVKSAQEVRSILKYANQEGIPVTPRGAGTNLVGSTVPLYGGIIIDLSKMDRVLELDKETFTVTVEPGILLKDLQSYVESQGLFYPPDPGEKESSIGGNISTNAGGMRAVKYGVTRDYVRGLEIVLADGTIVQAGGKNVKDASGLSIKNLITGSEGTLAVITKCLLKLVPKPQKTQSVLIPYKDLETGINSILKILQANANPTAIEFIQRKVVAMGEEFCKIKYPCPEAGSYILLTFDGYETEVSANIQRIKQVATATGAIDYIVLEDAQYAADIWKVRGALVTAVESFSEQEPVDIVVPINKTAEFIEYVNQVEKQTGMQMVAFGHAGDGNVHLCVVRGKRTQEQWEKELHENMAKIYGKAYAFGGLTSGEHGIGITKRPYFLTETKKENLAIMNSIKEAFDPKHILNEGKSYLKERK